MGNIKPQKETTKQCPKCGNTSLLTFPSLNFKACTDCYIKIPWYLEPGQKPYY